MYRSFISGIVASTLGVVSVVPVTGHPLCAVVSVDASHCATTSGRFAISFSRLKETAPDLEF